DADACRCGTAVDASPPARVTRIVSWRGSRAAGSRAALPPVLIAVRKRARRPSMLSAEPSGSLLAQGLAFYWGWRRCAEPPRQDNDQLKNRGLAALLRR